jgi:hypothetical protein
LQMTSGFLQLESTLCFVVSASDVMHVFVL